jgi:hypothetical protein
MNIEKALNRIQWRMTNEKFTPNEKDKEATDFLTNWIKQQKETEIKENLLFGKLFVRSLIIELVYWGCVKTSCRKIQEDMELPINYFYEKLKDTLNSQELEAFKKAIGYNMNHPQLRTQEQEQHNKKLIIKHREQFEKHAKGLWSDMEVYGSLNNQITEILNKYKNKP